MIDSLYPRISYENVRSAFVREQIREGSFYDVEHRQFVNSLTHVEWVARNGYPDCTGITASGIGYHDALVGLKYPRAYDRVRSEFGESTRTERRVYQDRDEDPELRRAWARRHRDEWDAVARDEACPDESAIADKPDERGEFNWFRFPRIPYTAVESAFIRDEVRAGAFDDYEYRQYVNRLVFVERWFRDGLGAVKTAYYHPIRAYHVAGMVPDGFRILQTELEREDIPPFGPKQRDRDEGKEHRYRESWQAAQTL